GRPALGRRRQWGPAGARGGARRRPRPRRRERGRYGDRPGAAPRAAPRRDGGEPGATARRVGRSGERQGDQHGPARRDRPRRGHRGRGGGAAGAARRRAGPGRRRGGRRRMSALVLYDTRTREKRRFEPLEPGHARVYSCGPTGYAPQHIGNLRPYLFADLLKRVLLAEGLRVTHVINITDVGHLTDDADAGEDKMEQAAARTGRSAAEIAALYTEQWLRDRRRLRCLEAEFYPRASEHVP